MNIGAEAEIVGLQGGFHKENRAWNSEPIIYTLYSYKRGCRASGRKTSKPRSGEASVVVLKFLKHNGPTASTTAVEGMTTLGKVPLEESDAQVNESRLTSVQYRKISELGVQVGLMNSC